MGISSKGTTLTFCFLAPFSTGAIVNFQKGFIVRASKPQGNHKSCSPLCKKWQKNMEVYSHTLKHIFDARYFAIPLLTQDFQDGRTAPGVCGNGSVPLSHSANVVTRIGIHTFAKKEPR